MEYSELIAVRYSVRASRRAFNSALKTRLFLAGEEKSLVERILDGIKNVMRQKFQKV